jgi:hypothetical protein
MKRRLYYPLNSDTPRPIGAPETFALGCCDMSDFQTAAIVMLLELSLEVARPKEEQRSLTVAARWRKLAKGDGKVIGDLQALFKQTQRGDNQSEQTGAQSFWQASYLSGRRRSFRRRLPSNRFLGSGLPADGFLNDSQARLLRRPTFLQCRDDGGPTSGT